MSTDVRVRTADALAIIEGALRGRNWQRILRELPPGHDLDEERVQALGWAMGHPSRSRLDAAMQQLVNVGQEFTTFELPSPTSAAAPPRPPRPLDPPTPVVPPVASVPPEHLQGAPEEAAAAAPAHDPAVSPAAGDVEQWRAAVAAEAQRLIDEVLVADRRRRVAALRMEIAHLEARIPAPAASRPAPASKRSPTGKTYPCPDCDYVGQWGAGLAAHRRHNHQES